MGPKRTRCSATTHCRTASLFDSVGGHLKRQAIHACLVDRQHGLDAPVARQLGQISVDGSSKMRENLKNKIK